MMTLTNENYTKKKTLKTILVFSLPPMISMLIQSLYNIVDSMYVAKLGNDAITAITYAMPLQNLVLAFAVGTGVGLNSYMSRKLGEKDYHSAVKVIYQGFFLTIITALLFILFGYLFIPSFFKLFTDNQNILTMCYDYTYIVVYFAIFQLVHILIEKIMQANGKMVFSMLMQALGAIINIILDPIFIFNLGMGVKGAAIATIIGQASAMVVSFGFLFLVKFPFKITLKDACISPKIIKEIYKVGFSSILMTGLTSFLVIFLNSILGNYSQDAVNTYGLYFRLQTFVFMPLSGLTQGILPILGYNYGAKCKHNLMLTFKQSLIIGLVLMGFGTILFEALPRQLLMLFSPSESLLDLGEHVLRIIAISFIPACFAIIIPTLFQALGKGFDSLIVYSLRQFIIVVPLAYLFSYLFGLEGIWYIFLIAEIVSAAISLLLLFRTLKKDLVLNVKC